MVSFENIPIEILNELLSDDLDIRAKYYKLFKSDVDVFVKNMTNAFSKYHALQVDAKSDKNKNYVAAMVYAAFSLNIVSLKLFLSGHIVAAGNILRQAVESIALALLFSGKDIDILKRFINDKYSSNRAIRDVMNKSIQLSINDDALKMLKDFQEFYHKYSHPTSRTLGTLVSISGGKTYAGASFDGNKIEIYRKEISLRIGLSKIFPSFIDVVLINIAKW